MNKNSKVRCDYKIMVDSFESDNIPVEVWLFADKKSVKRYCRDTGLDYKHGLDALYGTVV